MNPRLFDSNRASSVVTALQGVTHTVSDLGHAMLRIDETGDHVIAPLRMTVSDRLGVALEIGPYSLSVEDAILMRATLDQFIEQSQWAAGGLVDPEAQP